MSDDHSEVVPLLPIPNRTVKRFCADDSADSRVKVGHRQAIKQETPSRPTGRFFSSRSYWFVMAFHNAASLAAVSQCNEPVDYFPFMSEHLQFACFVTRVE